MFGLFKKSLHEPLKLQHQDLQMYPDGFRDSILGGEDCDEISTGFGEFGSLNNPIPVNGAMGEIKYLGKLRGKTGNACFFHRIGSFSSEATSNSVDVYEVVCLDGTQWAKLCFDFYHPRRSEKAPHGFVLTAFNKSLGMDLPLGFGVNGTVSNFPHDLPDMIVEAYGNEALGRRARKRLAKGRFDRPVDLG